MDKVKKRKELFIAAYKECGTIIQTCRMTGIYRSQVYRWKEEDPEFRDALEQAEEEATEALIAEARRRGLNGVDEPIYYKGKQVGAVKKYSDNLLMFLIKAKRPEYRDKVQNEIVTPPEGFNINITSMTPEERRARINELIAKRGTGVTPASGAGSQGTGTETD
ncbi:MAG TPA: helix-turn-helix domain-containing protein [Bacillota bacterium]|nr:helix-turn-helix domain-containing protein [Bacillota bacterium]